MLRFTDVNLKLIVNIKKYQITEIMIRSGISTICKDYVKANNKFLKSYGDIKPTLYIIYLEANNLFGQSMMQLFLTEILDWVDPKDFNFDNYSNDSPINCFLEVDLDYPDDLYNDYPLAGEKIEVTKEMLSDCQSQIIENNNFFLGTNSTFKTKKFI